MSFHNAPVTKALMLGIGINSLIGGAFQYRHFFRLQLVPHLTKHHQWWRLLTYQLAFQNSSDVFISQVVLYNASVALERIFGSRKYGSFIFTSGVVSTTLTLLCSSLAAWFGTNYSFSGPTSILFAILYSYSRVVPSSYRYRIAGLTWTDKSPLYIFAVFMAVSGPPESIILSIIGLITGAICRSDMLPFKAYRLPRWVNSTASLLRPLVGATEPGFRSISALPEHGMGTRTTEESNLNGEIDTASMGLSGSTGFDGGVSGGRTENAPRNPTQEDIAQLTAMFPNASRMQIVNALSSTSSVEAAVERLIQ